MGGRTRRGRGAGGEARRTVAESLRQRPFVDARPFQCPPFELSGYRSGRDTPSPPVPFPPLPPSPLSHPHPRLTLPPQLPSAPLPPPPAPPPAPLPPPPAPPPLPSLLRSPAFAPAPPCHPGRNWDVAAIGRTCMSRAVFGFTLRASSCSARRRPEERGEKSARGGEGSERRGRPATPGAQGAERPADRAATRARRVRFGACRRVDPRPRNATHPRWAGT